MKWRVRKGLSDYSNPAKVVHIYHIEVRYFGTWYIIETFVDKDLADEKKEYFANLPRKERMDALKKLHIA